jgi:hypothetical protein
MDPLKICLALAALSLLPVAAGAQTAAATGRSCTLTLDIASPHPANDDAEPVVFLDTIQTYPIASFRVERPQLAGNPMTATVTADLDLEPTLAMLLDQHAVIGRTELACPSKNVNIANATIGFIGSFGHSASGSTATLAFTLNFWPTQYRTS